MNSWWLIGGTTVFLICAVMASVIFVIKSGVSGSNEVYSSGGVRLAGVLLVVCVVVIVAAFIAYFNGFFNRYKTTQDRLRLKYDYLTYYEPVKLINGLSPAGVVSPTTFASISDELKTLFTNATSVLIQNKQRVEIALGNVSLTGDTQILSNYDFSLPCVKLGTFIIQNEALLRANQNAVMKLLSDALQDLGIDPNTYRFNISDGKQVTDQMDILVVIGLYVIFVQQYPSTAQTCIKNNACPFTS